MNIQMRGRQEILHFFVFQMIEKYVRRQIELIHSLYRSVRMFLCGMLIMHMKTNERGSPPFLIEFKTKFKYSRTKNARNFLLQ